MYDIEKHYTGNIVWAADLTVIFCAHKEGNTKEKFQRQTFTLHNRHYSALGIIFIHKKKQKTNISHNFVDSNFQGCIIRQHAAQISLKYLIWARLDLLKSL